MTIPEIVTDYLKRGWHPIYIPLKTKAPVDANWQKNDRPTPESIPKIWSKPSNIGIRLGHDSRNLIDFDLDSPEAMCIAAKVLPKTMCFGRKSKPSSHWIYYASGSLKTVQDKGVIELRCSGQTVFPGSVHPSGEEIAWFTTGCTEPSNISYDDALAHYLSITASSLLSKAWEKGKRDDLFLALTGGLLKAKNWDVKRTKDFITLVCLGAGDEEAHARLSKIERTAEKIKAGEHVQGWPTLRGLIGEQSVSRVMECLGIQVKRPLQIDEVSLDSIKEVEVTYLWEPYLPHGELAMVSGDPGIGKGWLSMAIASAVVTGGPLPGQKRTDKGKVLLFTAEDSLSKTVKRRFREFGVSSGVYCYEDAFGLDSDGLGFIEERIETHRPRLVIIDPFMSYTAESTETNSANDIKNILTPLSKLAQRYNTVILLVNHLTKGARDSALYRSLGSIAIVASVRTALMVSYDPDDPTKQKRIMVHSKSNIGAHGKSLLYIVDGKFKWEGESHRTADDAFEKQKPPTQQELAEDFLTTLHDGQEWMDLDEITSRTSISYKALQRARKSLGIETKTEGFGTDKKTFWKLKTEEM